MVSIIVPVYNAEKSIEKCINSIRMQSYRNIEIIALDDGSEDDSLEILKKIQKEEPRLKVLHHDNKGVSATRNLGILKSKGEYIQFVDADDYIDSKMTDKLVNSMQSKSLDLIMCLFQYKEQASCSTMGEFKQESINCFFEHFAEVMDNVLFQGPCNKLYRSQIIKDNNILFLENISKLEDSIFNAIYLKYCNRIMLLPEALYVYNYVENSLSHKFHMNEIYVMIMFYQKLIGAVEYRDKREELIRSILSYAFKQMETIYRVTWVNDKKEYKKRWLNYQKDMINYGGYKLLEPYENRVNIRLRVFFCFSKKNLYCASIIYYKCIEFIKKVVKRK